MYRNPIILPKVFKLHLFCFDFKSYSSVYVYNTIFIYCILFFIIIIHNVLSLY